MGAKNQEILRINHLQLLWNLYLTLYEQWVAFPIRKRGIALAQIQLHLHQIFFTLYRILAGKTGSLSQPFLILEEMVPKVSYQKFCKLLSLHLFQMRLTKSYQFASVLISYPLGELLKNACNHSVHFKHRRKVYQATPIITLFSV